MISINIFHVKPNYLHLIVAKFPDSAFSSTPFLGVHIFVCFYIITLDKSIINIDKNKHKWYISSVNEITEKITEVGIGEIHAPSGVFAKDGRELNNFEAITELVMAQGAYLVYVNMDGQLSPDAAAHNSSVTRSGVGEYKVALMAKYPPEHRS